ncbi:hypothetical protein PR048_010403 [Dryococelus australis]|uniref:ATP-dependent DNA helicase n=1 Tax=Dryococelus australis TaxID=614101 RepID=A0ABQ9I2M1_9NEOP|nr:hypothetical protein PR048_010403 [Dryococelus australis]
MRDSRLKQLKHIEDLFGGINMLLFGDLMQLPPVRGNEVFDQLLRLAPETHLWRLFTLVELTENMRQQGNASFVNILDALRIGELQSKHFVELISKIDTFRVATGATVAERLDYSPPTKAEPGSIPGRATPRFSHVGIELDYFASFLAPAPSFPRCSILTSITLISSQYLDVKSRPNLFTHFTLSKRA